MQERSQDCSEGQVAPLFLQGRRTHSLLVSLHSVLFELLLQTAASLQADLLLVLHLQ